MIRLLASEQGTTALLEAPEVLDDVPAPPGLATGPAGARPARLLLVGGDDDLRTTLRATLEAVGAELAEASSAAWARILVEEEQPDAIVLDASIPAGDRLTLCRELAGDRATAHVGVFVLADSSVDEEAALAAGAEACLRKPFAPLDFLRLIAHAPTGSEPPVEAERRNGVPGDPAGLETLDVLAEALGGKPAESRAHAHRVRLYAAELAAELEPRLLDDPSVQYGFLLHDVGAIAIPDAILLKPNALDATERSLVETHAALGELLLAPIPLLQGAGLGVVRHHHERWDGRGYPDGLAGDAIPLAARIFAVADALDAMTSDRPYRAARTWDAAVQEVTAEAGRQFDPDVAAALVRREPRLREIYERDAAEAA